MVLGSSGKRSSTESCGPALARRSNTRTGAELFAGAALQYSVRVFAIQFCDKTGADLGGTHRFAFVSVGAIIEAFRIHDLHHFQSACEAVMLSLGHQRQVGDVDRIEPRGPASLIVCCRL